MRKTVLCFFLILSVLYGAVLPCASAETVKIQVLDCHYQAPVGEGYAGYCVHVHNTDCFDTYYELYCPLPYIPPHVHTDACYGPDGIPVCGQLELHAHTKYCYTDGVLTCGIPELREHVHGPECFKTQIVERDEDTGAETFLSEPYADLETDEDWERSVAGAELTGDWNHDLVAIAKTQLGYTRSETNIAVGGEFAGGHYTRYGDWYGYPYGAWCAMFVSFCLHYAGIPVSAFPRESGTVSWVHRLMQRGMFGMQGKYEPVPGDIVFFDGDDGKADHVGIVIGTEDGVLSVIEGNHTSTVEVFRYPGFRYVTYILGYGILPKNSESVPIQDSLSVLS